MALSLALNGRPQTFETLEPGVSLLTLVEALALKADRIAVEVNGEIAPRRTWEATAIHSGDKLEVVHFVGGGCPDVAPLRRDTLD